MAIAGGTKDVIIANTTASLKSQLNAAISQIIASKLSFTAPAITASPNWPILLMPDNTGTDYRGS